MLYFYVYPSAFQNPGGGEILLIKTRQYLEREGIEVRLFDQWRDVFKAGDILHVFGSVKEALGLMETGRSKGVRIVHSPIIWYNWQSSLRIAYSIKERAFCIVRHAVKSFLPAFPSSRKRMIQLADLVLAGSKGEAEQISRYFLIPENKIRVIHYGVEPKFAHADPKLFESKYHLEKFVLMVGRIEPRKNQLQLIRAMKNQPIPLVLIGDPVAHHSSYYQLCQREAGKNIHFLGSFSPDSEELASAFRACQVFVLPTWFETPGLAALEAGMAGANIVITREGSTREYFQNHADYINPEDPLDIRRAVLKAFHRPKNALLSNFIANRYTWPRTAQEHIKVYRSLESSVIGAAPEKDGQ